MVVVSLLFAALVAVGAVVTLEIARRFLALAWRSPPAARPVARETLVLRPVKGIDPWIEKNLAFRIALPPSLGTCREAISVEAREDPAHLTALRVARADPAVHVSAGALPLPNPKVSHLAYAMKALPRCDHALVVDADVDPRTLDLESLLAALEDPEVEAAWQPVVEGPGETAGDLLSEAILLGSFHAFPLLGLLDEGGLVGKVSIVRTDALDEMGGLDAFGHVLGEDMALAASVRARGRRTRMVTNVARSCARGRSVRDVFDRFVRWTLVTKSQRPGKLVTYPLFFFPLPLVVVAAALLTLPHAGILVTVAACTRAALALLGVARARAWRRLPSVLVAAPTADFVLAAAWLRALTLRTVDWRGTPMRLARGGRLGTTALGP
jgi:ceramide glucosyltransferase